MRSPEEARQLRAQLVVWWVLWGAMLFSLGAVWAIASFARLPAAPPGTHPLVHLVGFVPLFVSVVIRWLVLPRYRSLGAALPLFVVGLALAEACGLLGLFLGGPYRDDLALLGMFGLGQFAPLFARRLAEPRSSGFIPNN